MKTVNRRLGCIYTLLVSLCGHVTMSIERPSCLMLSCSAKTVSTFPVQIEPIKCVSRADGEKW